MVQLNGNCTYILKATATQAAKKKNHMELLEIIVLSQVKILFERLTIPLESAEERII